MCYFDNNFNCWVFDVVEHWYEKNRKTFLFDNIIQSLIWNFFQRFLLQSSVNNELGYTVLSSRLEFHLCLYLFMMLAPCQPALVPLGPQWSTVIGQTPSIMDSHIQVDPQTHTCTLGSKVFKKDS